MLRKDLIHIVAEIAALLQDDLGLMGEIQKRDVGPQGQGMAGRNRQIEGLPDDPRR